MELCLLPLEQKNTQMFEDAVTRGVLKTNVLLRISENSQENTCAGACFFKKIDSGTGVLLWILRNFKKIVFTIHLEATALAVRTKNPHVY